METGKYLAIFLDEGRELVSLLVQQLLRLEENGRDGRAMESALRLAHTLKGSSRMVGLAGVSGAAHHVEDELKRHEADPSYLGSERINLLLGVMDRVSGAFDAVAGGGVEPGSLFPEGAEGEAPRPVPREREESPPSPRRARPPEEGGRSLAGESLRVRTDRVDEIVEISEDLIVQKWRFLVASRRVADAVRVSGPSAPPGADEAVEEFLQEVNRFSRLAGQLQAAALDLRLMPIRVLLADYPRLVRDLARQLGKEAALEVEGEATELDRSILEKIEGPLTHLLRNALDHGVEPPEERLAAGKPSRGTVRVRAFQKPGAVVIEVEDDGRGIDVEDVRRTAVARGFLTPAEALAMGEGDLFYLLCRPGFTTRERADEVSGRGVGLDVVKVRLEKIQGSVSIASEKGKFTRFRLFLPQSLSVLRGVLARVADNPAVIPSHFVEKCVGLPSRDLMEAGGTVLHEGQRATVVSLGALLGRSPEPVRGEVQVMLLRFRGRLMPIAADGIEEEREVVVKGLGAHLADTPCVLGVTILGDGRAAPILDVPQLYDRWQGVELSCRLPAPQVSAPLRVLLVDDAVTSRHVVATILEQMGHEVIEAQDGAEGLKLLDQQLVDLVITDVDMPRMDGIEMVRRLRRSERHKRIAVIMISARGGERDRARGYDAGVDAYISKDRLNGPALRHTLGNMFPEA